MDIKKTITNIFIKTASIFFNLSNWLEFKADFSWISNIGSKMLKIGKKIYSKSFCSGCGRVLKLCYDGRRKRDENTVLYCCECGRIPKD